MSETRTDERQPAEQGARRPLLHGLGWVITLWLFASAIFIGQTRLNYELANGSFQLARSLHFDIAYHAAWLIFIPFIYLLAARTSLERHRLRHLALLAGVGIGFASAHGLLAQTLMQLLETGHFPPPRILTAPNVYLGGFATHFWLYAVTVGFCYALLYHQRFQERTLRAERLMSQLTTARLTALQAQLQPHFLFNALNSATALAATDARATQSLLVGLSTLLRHSLDIGSRLESPLADELDFLDRYVAIERIRHGDRLHVRYDVSDDALREIVPTLILQPLAENAIRHAVATRTAPSEIIVRAFTRGADLVLEVVDDGPGVAAPSSGSTTGRGIANVRSRLETAFGSRARFELVNGTPTGTIARVVLPRSSPSRADAA